MINQPDIIIIHAYDVRYGDISACGAELIKTRILINLLKKGFVSLEVGFYESFLLPASNDRVPTVYEKDHHA